MKRKTIYLILCALGAIIPYTKFVPWLAHNGLNWRLFLGQMVANDIASFFALDVVMSAVVVLLFSRLEGRQTRIGNRWLVPVALITVGVSLGLPLFLYLRERAIEDSAGKPCEKNLSAPSAQIP